MLGNPVPGVADGEQIAAAAGLQGDLDAPLVYPFDRRQEAINIASGEREAAIARSEGEKQASINRAEGQAKAIIALAAANSEALRQIGAAIREPGGQEAVNLKVAEQYVGAFGALAKTNNSIIVPANMGDMGGLIATAMQIVKTQK